MSITPAKSKRPVKRTAAPLSAKHRHAIALRSVCHAKQPGMALQVAKKYGISWPEAAALRTLYGLPTVASPWDGMGARGSAP